MATKKLNKRDWERMGAYAYGFFYGASGYELNAPYSDEDQDYNLVIEGFIAGHEIYLMSDDDDYIPYEFGIPEDEDGKYVHIHPEHVRKEWK